MVESAHEPPTAQGPYGELTPASAGFLFGANLPWLDYGLDFGANAWRPDGGLGRNDGGDARGRLARELALLAEGGVRSVRWFLFCDGRAGIRFDSDGRASQLDDAVLRDLDVALKEVERAGLSVIFVLMDFHWFQAARIVDGVQLGGRGGVLEDSRARGRLFDVAFRPLLERYAGTSSILAWDVINEPEWVNRKGLRSFLMEAIALIRSCTTQRITVGSAGARWRGWYRDLDVDFYQVHWYDSLGHRPPLATPVAALGFDRPVILGEFPTRGSSWSVEEIIEASRAAGYAGAFYWSALSSDECSDPSRRPICKAGSSLLPQSSAKWSRR